VAYFTVISQYLFGANEEYNGKKFRQDKIAVF
jgi:hypothetical protein